MPFNLLKKAKSLFFQRNNGYTQLPEPPKPIKFTFLTITKTTPRGRKTCLYFKPHWLDDFDVEALPFETTPETPDPLKLYRRRTLKPATTNLLVPTKWNDDLINDFNPTRFGRPNSYKDYEKRRDSKRSKELPSLPTKIRQTKSTPNFNAEHN